MQNQIDNEDEELSIKEGDFRHWIEDPVTKTVFKYLNHCLEMNKERRLSPVYVQDPNGLIKLNEFLGYERALEEVLNIGNKLIEVNNEEDSSTNVEDIGQA